MRYGIVADAGLLSQGHFSHRNVGGLQKIYSKAADMMHLFCLQVLHYDPSTGENELGLNELHCRPDEVFGYPSLSSFIGVSDIRGGGGQKKVPVALGTRWDKA